MLNDPLFWSLLILLICGEIWVGVSKVAKRLRAGALDGPEALKRLAG